MPSGDDGIVAMNAPSSPVCGGGVASYATAGVMNPIALARRGHFPLAASAKGKRSTIPAP